MGAVEDRVKIRERFLLALYDATYGNRTDTVNMWELGKALGFDSHTTESVVDYLDGEGYLGQGYLGGGICLSHSGIQASERLQCGSGATTERPSVTNVMYVGSVLNSQIQLGTYGSSQSISNEPSLDAIRQFMVQLLESVDQLPLSPDARSALVADAATVKAQVESPTPKKSILGECLCSIRSILEQVAGNVVAQSLLVALHGLS